jgi:enamidase
MPFGGLAIHRELEILRECGLSPAEVLASATGGAARAMRLSDRLGTIEPDRAADLLVVRGDPSVDLAALRRIDLVMRDGRAVSGPLAEVLSAEPPR